MGMQGKIKEYYKKMYGHKFDNLHKMDGFLERQKLPKLTQREIYNLNVLVSTEDISSIMNNLAPTKTNKQNNNGPRSFHW